jgi:imidazolonepropionase-like amidohydrolase
MKMPHTFLSLILALLSCAPLAAQSAQPKSAPGTHAIVLHAARLLNVESGRITTPGEILINGDAIAEVGAKVTRPSGAEIIDLGDATLLPGLIDAHVHLFLHPGAEDLQTVEESAPQRTIMATLAARDDLMAGFTAERDMGTEGAGSADTAVRDAINRGQIPGPRLRISGNAVNILGGHEDAIGFNPEQHLLPNPTYANNAADLVTVIREQFKEGADFIKIYETGKDSLVDGRFITPFQYTEDELSLPCARLRAQAIASRYTLLVSPEHSTLLAPASSRSTTPIH